MDDLNALPYLDMVLREVLRLYSPAPSSERTAAEDDVIPLNTPFTDRNGRLHHGIAYVCSSASPSVTN